MIAYIYCDEFITALRVVRPARSLVKVRGGLVTKSSPLEYCHLLNTFKSMIPNFYCSFDLMIFFLTMDIGKYV